jgi:hypothetical protein
MRERKLTDQQVTEIQALAKTTMKKVDIAQRYGISPQLVSTVIRYGYTSRPTRVRNLKAGEEPGSWEELATFFNRRYPDEPGISGDEAKRIHDMALKKIAAYWASKGITKADEV